MNLTASSNTSLFSSMPSAQAKQTISQLLGGGDFTGYFESLLSASRSKALPSIDQRISLVPAQSKLQQQTVLFKAFSGAYSTKSFGFGMLGGMSELTSMPSWVYDMQRVMGNDQIDGLLDIQKQMAALATKQFDKNSGLGSFSSLI